MLGFSGMVRTCFVRCQHSISVSTEMSLLLGSVAPDVLTVCNVPLTSILPCGLTYYLDTF